MKNNIAISFTESTLAKQAETLALQLAVPVVTINDKSHAYLLVYTSRHLELVSVKNPDFNPIFVDFTHGASMHRYRYGGGKGQLIAKAVGMQRHSSLHVLDVTAGLGGDAFVLASLGCHVMMCERSAIIASLLQDGLIRAQSEPWFSDLTLAFKQVDGIAFLKNSKVNEYDVVYIDPMFPETKKTALVKKEMQILRDVVGNDLDAGELLEAALEKAKYRVVVKRPRLATQVNDLKPDVVYDGKSCRYDVYLNTKRG